MVLNQKMKNELLGCKTYQIFKNPNRFSKICRVCSFTAAVVTKQDIHFSSLNS